MKLSIVFPVMNQLQLFRNVYSQLRKVTSTVEQDIEFVIIDNGSDIPITELDCPGATIVRNEKSIGVYPTFKQGFEITTGDIVAFFHSDLVVWESMWNIRLIERFEKNVKLGMIGFIGSSEIDTSGGRGLGTTSNFKGLVLVDEFQKGSHIGIKTWSGSPGYVHGKYSEDASKAAVIDGCAMILTREAWNKIGYRENFAPHHFYDRLISCQMLEGGYEIEVLGIACDHISGQTVNQEQAYHDFAKQWLLDHNYIVNDMSPIQNFDSAIYQIAEKMWFDEYKPKGYIPYKVT